MASDMSLLLTACVAVNLLDVNLMCSNCALNPQLFRGEVLYFAIASAQDHSFARARVRADDHSHILDADLLEQLGHANPFRNRQEKVKTPKIFLENKNKIKRGKKREIFMDKRKKWKEVKYSSKNKNKKIKKLVSSSMCAHTVLRCDLGQTKTRSLMSQVARAAYRQRVKHTQV